MMDDETNDGRSAKFKYEEKDFSAKSTYGRCHRAALRSTTAMHPLWSIKPTSSPVVTCSREPSYAASTKAGQSTSWSLKTVSSTKENATDPSPLWPRQPPANIGTAITSSVYVRKELNDGTR